MPVDICHDCGGGDWSDGIRAALVFCMLSGLPLALAAVAVLLATWRRAPRPWPPAAALAFRTAFAVECGSFLTATSFFVFWALVGGLPVLADPVGVLLFVTMLASAAALPAWRSAMLASSPEPAPSILTGRLR